MITLNERIRDLRKDLGLSQKDFSSRIGVSQRAISWGEQAGNNVPDSTIKSICLAFGVNESWLRTGEGEMYAKESTFSLDAYLKDRQATDLELEIVNAYFDMPPDLRRAVINHFTSRLRKTDSTILNTAAGTENDG